MHAMTESSEASRGNGTDWTNKWLSLMRDICNQRHVLSSNLKAVVRAPNRRDMVYI